MPTPWKDELTTSQLTCKYARFTSVNTSVETAQTPTINKHKTLKITVDWKSMASQAENAHEHTSRRTTGKKTYFLQLHPLDTAPHHSQTVAGHQVSLLWGAQGRHYVDYVAVHSGNRGWTILTTLKATRAFCWVASVRLTQFTSCQRWPNLSATY